MLQYPQDFPRVELTHVDAAAINTMVQNVENGGHRWNGDVLVIREKDLILVAHVESLAACPPQRKGNDEAEIAPFSTGVGRGECP